ncbi:hypothetical protein GCM10009863_46950 [Streptomyces axinellae]|uniref:Uncharacterized protein n=1 Tax=Streptomyces axinellae TaxID=552788 RepID=A0ABN3QHK7_9ACTN
MAPSPVEGFELARQLLAGGRCPCVPDSHRSLGAGRGDGERRLLLPCAARSAVGGDGDLQFLAERGDERTKRGVWYFAAVFPPRVRQALPAGASQFGQS